MFLNSANLIFKGSCLHFEESVIFTYLLSVVKTFVDNVRVVVEDSSNRKQRLENIISQL